MGPLLAALLAGLAAYAAAIAGLYLAQDALVFPRGLVAAARPPPAGAERLELRSADGHHRLVGTLIPASAAPPGPGRALLLAFAGNAANADDLAAYLARRLPDLDVAALNYRGYAPSEGRPDEAALAADASGLHDHLVRRLGPARVLAAGFSLGSGVAARLAAARRLDGLLLVTPFDSLEAVARTHYPWVPVGRLLRHRFRSDLHLAGLDTPAAVIAAGNDRVVPPRHTLALVRALARPVLVETLPNTSHNGIYEAPGMEEALRRAVDALLDAAGPTAAGPANPAATGAYRGAG